MAKTAALLKKELLVLSKDVQGLLVLFAMPAVFILIMSLAMQDAFDEQKQVTVSYAIADRFQDTLSQKLISQLQQTAAFKQTLLDSSIADLSIIKQQVLDGKFDFAVIIPADFPQRLNADTATETMVEVFFAPTVKPYLRQMFLATLRAALIKQKVSVALSAMGSGSQNEAQTETAIQQLSEVTIGEQYLFADQQQSHTPTSVQQNVPAWLVFAMFFVIIPISTAFIIEKQLGTFIRLRVMNISAANLLLAKFVPYYFVNQVQMLAMIAVGVFVVPLLGGDKLNMASSIVGLLTISSAVSFAAISFALLIATIAKTTMQATTLGGVFNIIFGALGGIMVPKFVMPPLMQDITVVSPMSWGLEGFLDVFLRNADWSAVLPESTALLIFGTLCLALAAVFFRKIV
ncbi:ABC transporter permease [Kaarinaea lacus]